MDREDIQGIVASGYKHLDYARFVFLEIIDPVATRTWLDDIVNLVTSARHPGDNKLGTSLNVAFSSEGLEALIPNRLKGFPHEFVRGMSTYDANRILGDSGESAPRDWEYGAPSQKPLHLLLMLYGNTNLELQSLHRAVFDSSAFSDGMCVVAQQDSVRKHGDETEPFGFRDGISQPPVQGLLGRGEQGESPISAGEFVLGYKNELGLLAGIPSIDNWADPAGYLAEHPQYPGKCRAFGMNGTYLVFRKLLQRVDQFWGYIKDISSGPNDSELIAAKMVGRWRSGAPLVLSPETPASEPRNDFLFTETDPDGLACPIGSHIRRAHPRDSLDMPPARSLLISRRHRLIRRARKFSTLIKDSTKRNPKYEQGLYFIALNADLRRQYEFVQQQWINDPCFNGLDNDRDPIIGDNSTLGEFTINAKPISKHLRGLPQFVILRGGGYFFLPGIRAIKFLANYQL